MATDIAFRILLPRCMGSNADQSRSCFWNVCVLRLQANGWVSKLVAWQYNRAICPSVLLSQRDISLARACDLLGRVVHVKSHWICDDAMHCSLFRNGLLVHHLDYVL